MFVFEFSHLKNVLWQYKNTRAFFLLLLEAHQISTRFDDCEQQTFRQRLNNLLLTRSASLMLFIYLYISFNYLL